MSGVLTYISFPGNAREAFEHYRDVFGGELHLQTYQDTGMSDMPFVTNPAAVAHAVLTLGEGQIAGGDSFEEPGSYPLEGSAYSLLYMVDTPEEGQRLIDALIAAGGELAMPFEEAPWGQYYGQVFDKFRVMWAFSTPN